MQKDLAECPYFCADDTTTIPVRCPCRYLFCEGKALVLGDVVFFLRPVYAWGRLVVQCGYVDGLRV